MEIDKLVPALLAAQIEFPVIGFDATNPHFRNRYATLAHLIAETRPVLAKHGLVVSQLVDGDSVVTLLMHTSGQQLSGRTPIVSDKPGPQAMGSGITYARRYGLSAILGVAPEDDDDGEGAQSRSPKQAPTPKPKPPAPQRPAQTPTAANAGTPSWFGEAIRGGQHAGKTWKEMAAGSLGGQRHKYIDWMALKAQKLEHETVERARYVLSLYAAREVGERPAVGSADAKF